MRLKHSSRQRESRRPLRGREAPTRAYAIFLLLRTQRRFTAETLAEKFGVNTRTIYRDIGLLQEAGVTIASTTGPGGGYALLRDDGFDPVLRNDLSNTVTGSLASAPEMQQRRQAAFARAIELAEDYLSEEDRTYIRKSRERIFFDTDEWYWKEKPPEELVTVQRAVLDELVTEIEFRERDTDEHQQEEVEPYGLIWRGGFWYLVAYSRSKSIFRRYRLQRIRSVRVTTQPFRRNDAFDLKAFWADDLAQFGVGHTKVVLRIERSALAEFETFDWKQTTVIRKFDDHWIAEMLVDRFDWLVPLALSFAGAVSVLEPRELREQVRSNAKRVLDGHGDLGADSASVDWSDSRSRATRGR